jgi:transcriptional regulator with XRE-family HTH domain
MDIEYDWILLKIKKIIKERQTKIEHIAKSIGVSNGEFSKILNGERLNYYKHIPAIAEYFNIPFLSFVKEDSSNLAIKNQSISQHPDYQLLNGNIIQFEEIIKAKEANIKTLEELVISEREAKENYKRKYENCKEKLRLSETKKS